MKVRVFLIIIATFLIFGYQNCGGGFRSITDPKSQLGSFGFFKSGVGSSDIQIEVDPIENAPLGVSTYNVKGRVLNLKKSLVNIAELVELENSTGILRVKIRTLLIDGNDFLALAKNGLSSSPSGIIGESTDEIKWSPISGEISTAFSSIQEEIDKNISIITSSVSGGHVAAMIRVEIEYSDKAVGSTVLDRFDLQSVSNLFGIVDRQRGNPNRFPALTVGPSNNLDFGDVQLGGVSILDVNVQNTGDADMFDVSSGGISGGFIFLGGGYPGLGGSCGDTLRAGQSCNLKIAFSPYKKSHTGLQSDELVVTYSGGSATINLNAKGLENSVSIVREDENGTAVPIVKYFGAIGSERWYEIRHDESDQIRSNDCSASLVNSGSTEQTNFSFDLNEIQCVVQFEKFSGYLLLRNDGSSQVWY